MEMLLGPILNAILPIINKLIPDPQAQAQIQLELTKALTDKENGVLNAMKDVMVADSQQDDKYTKRARPSVVYWSMAMVTYIIGAASVGHATAIVNALSAVPTDLYNMMMVGIGAFGLSRGVEKGIGALKKK